MGLIVRSRLSNGIAIPREATEKPSSKVRRWRGTNNSNAPGSSAFRRVTRRPMSSHDICVLTRAAHQPNTRHILRQLPSKGVLAILLARSRLADATDSFASDPRCEQHDERTRCNFVKASGNVGDGANCRCIPANQIFARRVVFSRGAATPRAIWPEHDRRPNRKQVAQACAYFWGPLPWMIEAAALISLASPRLVGFRRGGRSAHLQRRRRLLAGLQGRQRARCAEERVGAAGARAARRRMGHRSMPPIWSPATWSSRRAARSCRPIFC